MSLLPDRDLTSDPKPKKEKTPEQIQLDYLKKLAKTKRQWSDQLKLALMRKRGAASIVGGSFAERMADELGESIQRWFLNPQSEEILDRIHRNGVMAFDAGVDGVSVDDLKSTEGSASTAQWDDQNNAYAIRLALNGGRLSGAMWASRNPAP